VVAGRVEDAEDDDGIAFNAVEELVRKPPAQDAPEPPVVKGKAFGGPFQPCERIRHGEEELAAQARALAFISLLSLAKVGRGGGAGRNAKG
jgi:hypothetical protein